MTRASVSYDHDELRAVERVLGTRGLAASVRAAFNLVLQVEAEDKRAQAKERLIKRLRSMEGLDLDRAEVVEQAWR